MSDLSPTPADTASDPSWLATFLSEPWWAGVGALVALAIPALGWVLAQRKQTVGPTPERPATTSSFLFAAWGGIGVVALIALISAGASHVLWVAAFIIWLAWGGAANLVHQDEIRAREIAKHEAAPKRYRDRVGTLLTQLETLLLPDTAAQNPRPSGWSDRFDWGLTPLARDAEDLKRLRKNPLSWPVHDLAMRVAIAYPLLFVIAQFLVTGEAVTMAGYDLIPEDTPYGWTLATFGLVAAALTARILAKATSQGIFEKLATWLYWGAGALAFALALALAFAFAFAFAGAFALAVALAGAFAVALAVALAGALAFALALALALAFAFAFALAVAVAVALAVAAITFAFCRRGQNWGQSAFLVFHAAAFGGATLAAIHIPEGDPATIWIVAFALLPVVNAFFDWLSYGLTILLLSSGHRLQGPWRLVFGLLDVVAAAVLCFALSLALIGTLTLVDTYRDVPLFDLTALLRDIQAGQLGDHAWVLAMVASTLIPTLVHLAIGFFSIMTFVRGSVWTALAARMSRQGTLEQQLGASFAFGTLSLAYLVVPMSLLWGVVYALWLYGGAIAARYAMTLEAVAVRFGWLSA